MSIALLVFVVVLIVIVGILIVLLEAMPIDGTVKLVGKVLLLLIALVWIVQRAGLL